MAQGFAGLARERWLAASAYETLSSSPNHQPPNSTKDGRYQVSYPDDDDYRDEHDDPTSTDRERFDD